MISAFPLFAPSSRLRTALCVLLLSGSVAFAHEGEDHSQDKKKPQPALAASGVLSSAAGAVSREAPVKLPDGSLFVPKFVQRQLDVRTVQVALSELSAAAELNGRVVVDPGAGGRIQATQTGTVMAGSRGFPSPGTRVVKGETVAWLHPVVNSLERGSQTSAQAELAAQKTLVERRVQRLAQLEGSVPAKDIEAAHVELRALTTRLAALKTGLDAPQPLRAPASGVISAAHVVAGEVVDAKDILFEVVDPARLMVEALVYDAGLATRIAKTALHAGEAGNASLQLRLTGAGLQLREQALPVVFRVESASAAISVGQPVRVLASTQASGRGMAVPKAALAMGGSGETLVWVHSAPERFEPRRVTHRVLDADRVAIASGLKPGERVVTSGATLLSQIR